MFAVAGEAIKRNTGARGLRAILEQAMLEVMYDLPTHGDVKKCIVTRDSIVKGERPVLVYADGTEVRGGGKHPSAEKKAEAGKAESA